MCEYWLSVLWIGVHEITTDRWVHPEGPARGQHHRLGPPLAYQLMDRLWQPLGATARVFTSIKLDGRINFFETHWMAESLSKFILSKLFYVQILLFDERLPSLQMEGLETSMLSEPHLNLVIWALWNDTVRFVFVKLVVECDRIRAVSLQARCEDFVLMNRNR